jgi:AAHS family 4-hydroxybenzoate transporter-like MFS transporter
MKNEITVSSLTEATKISSISKLVVSLCFLMMITDGYDTTALANAIPQIIRSWGVDKVAAGGVFSNQLFGLMIGSLVFGYVGDKIGRKSVLVGGTLFFALSSLATAYAQDIYQLYVVRFLFGLGIGAILPSAVAICNEYVPQRFRVTVIGFIWLGYASGNAIGSFLAAKIVPMTGWQTLFQIGGYLPIVVAIAMYFYLPESIRFLALKEGGSERTQKVARAMRPDLDVTSDTRVILDAELFTKVKFVLSDLFYGPLKYSTVFLWLIYIANSMAAFYLSSWLPTLFQTAGLSQSSSSIALGFMAVGGAVGGITIGRTIDKFGLPMFAAAPGIGCLIVASLGYLASGSDLLVFASVFCSGFFVGGTQTCLHGLAGKIYPTAIRANGVGWALGVAKIGSISGPFIAGVLLQWNFSVTALFLAASVPCGVSFLAALGLLHFFENTPQSASTPAVSAA